MREIIVAFINEHLLSDFAELKTGRYESRKLHEFIERAIDDLKKMPSCGTKIPKKVWPKVYILKFKITNLWKYDLPNGWRLIYTIDENEIRIMNIILEWFNHKNYEKRFNY